MTVTVTDCEAGELPNHHRTDAAASRELFERGQRAVKFLQFRVSLLVGLGTTNERLLGCQDGRRTDSPLQFFLGDSPFLPLQPTFLSITNCEGRGRAVIDRSQPPNAAVIYKQDLRCSFASLWNADNPNWSAAEKNVGLKKEQRW